MVSWTKTNKSRQFTGGPAVLVTRGSTHPNHVLTIVPCRDGTEERGEVRTQAHTSFVHEFYFKRYALYAGYLQMFYASLPDQSKKAAAVVEEVIEHEKVWVADGCTHHDTDVCIYDCSP